MTRRAPVTIAAPGKRAALGRTRKARVPARPQPRSAHCSREDSRRRGARFGSAPADTPPAPAATPGAAPEPACRRRPSSRSITPRSGRVWSRARYRQLPLPGLGGLRWPMRAEHTGGYLPALPRTPPRPSQPLPPSPGSSRPRRTKDLGPRAWVLAPSCPPGGRAAAERRKGSRPYSPSCHRTSHPRAQPHHYQSRIITAAAPSSRPHYHHGGIIITPASSSPRVQRHRLHTQRRSQSPA